jgi:hypothetical protein
MSRNKKIIALATVGISVLVAGAANASIQPSSILGQALGGGNGSLIDRILAQTTADDETMAFLKEVSSKVTTGQAFGLSDVNGVAGIELFRKDGGINVQAILNDSQDSAYSISKSTIGTDTPLSTDTIMQSQATQTAREAMAKNSKVNEKLAESTSTVLKDAATTYNDVVNAPPDSSLEAIEQSNQVAIATGSINAQQIKASQSLGRTMETANVLAAAAQQQKSTERFYKDIDAQIIRSDEQMSRAISQARRKP